MAAPRLRPLGGRRRAAPAAREPWTPEQVGQRDAAYAVALIDALAGDRRRQALAVRFGFISQPHGWGRAESQAAAGVAARSSATSSSPPQHDGSARPAGARAADPSTRARGDGQDAGEHGHERRNAARRPRRRSAGKVAERAADWANKCEQRRRRALLAALPFVGAYIRRVESVGSNGDEPMRPAAAHGGDGMLLGSVGRPVAGAAGGARGGGVGGGSSPQPAPLAGAKRSCVRRSSTSAAAGVEAGKRCAGDGGSSEPAAACAAAGAPRPQPIRLLLPVQHGTLCGGCGLYTVDIDEFSGQGWLCEACEQDCLAAAWR